MTGTAGSRLRAALRNPGRAVLVSLYLLRGRLYPILCRLRGVRFTAGKNLRIEGRLIVRGPGRVVLGDNVRVARTVTPWTYSPDAVISIGDNTVLNGTRFGCAREISIGRDCLLAEANIFDTDFHSTRADRRNPEAPVRVAPVRLEDNVWVGGRTGILPGTVIGRNSVVSYGAVCAAKYPENVVIAGNPARVAAPIPPLPGTEAAKPEPSGT